MELVGVAWTRDYLAGTSYPMIVFPSANGFVLATIDFEELFIEADNIQYGIDCIRSAIIQRTTRSYPPSPTPVNELVLNNGEFVVMVNI